MIPHSLIQGESAKWELKKPELEGANLAYHFLGVKNREKLFVGGNETAPGVFEFEITGSETTGRAVDLYKWQLHSILDGARKILASGALDLRLSFDSEADIDDRSEAERDLASIRAVIRVFCDQNVQEYEITLAGSKRVFKKIELSQLLQREKELVNRVNGERIAARAARGMSFLTPIRATFRDAQRIKRC
jgi:hypothetical protein